jgi:hypothetical protein
MQHARVASVDPAGHAQTPSPGHAQTLPRPAFSSFFFLLSSSSSLLSSSLLSFLHAFFPGCTRTARKLQHISQIPSDLANKTSTFCCY